MDTKQKTRAGLAGGLAALALIVGDASIASGDTSSATTPSSQTRPAADSPQQTAPSGPRGDRSGHHPCPKEGNGPGSGSSQQQEQTAPSAPSAGSTTTPET